MTDDTQTSDDRYLEDNASSTMSLPPSVTDYPIEFGQTYHAYKAGRYLIPNDRAEQLWQIRHHYLVQEVTGSLYHAPVPRNLERVLDLGAGTGSWAIDFADRHPDTEVLGNDLTPAVGISVPPNVKLIVDDVEDEWMYENRPFDFIHCRTISRGIGNMDYLVRQAYECCKPGGWVEFADWNLIPSSPDGSVSGTPIDFGCRTTYYVFKQLGYYTSITPAFTDILENAGFEDIRACIYEVPLNDWCSDPRQQSIGAEFASQLRQIYEPHSLAAMKRMGWTEQQASTFSATVRTAIDDPNIHGVFNYYVFTAQKPPTA